VEALGRRITVLNILAGPLFVLVFAAGVYTFRRRRLRAIAEFKRTT
jgi:hypothetical protein